MKKPRKRRRDAGRKRVDVIHWINHSTNEEFWTRYADHDTITLCGKRFWKKRTHSRNSVSWARELTVRSLDGSRVVEPRPVAVNGGYLERRNCKTCEQIANLTPSGRAVMLAAQNAKRSAAFGRLKSKAEEKKAAQLAELKARIEVARVDAQACLDAFETAFVQSIFGQSHEAWLKVQRCPQWVVTKTDDHGTAVEKARCRFSRVDKHNVCEAPTATPMIDVHDVLRLAVEAHKIEHGSRGKNRWVTRSIVDNDGDDPQRRPTHCSITCRFCDRIIVNKWPLNAPPETAAQDIEGRTYHVGRHTTRCALRYLLGHDVKVLPAWDDDPAFFVEDTADQKGASV